MRTYAHPCPATLLLAPAAAHARVVVVASGDSSATLVDVRTNAVASRVGMPGRTRAVAASPDGARAYVAAGRSVVWLDLGARIREAAVRLSSTPMALAASRDGTRVYAARRNSLDVLDVATAARVAATASPARRATSPSPPPACARSSCSRAGAWRSST